MNVEIPRVNHDDGFDFVPGHPGWLATKEYNSDKKQKPLIRCNCGALCGIGLHHVHADGTVTASFYHQKRPEDPRGCEWHVFLKLLDYDQGDFPSDPK